MRCSLVLCGVVLFLAGCGKQPGATPNPEPNPDPVVPVITPEPGVQPLPNPTPEVFPPLPQAEGKPEERYDAAMLEAYTQLAQGKYAEALAAFEAAKAITPTEVVQREIDRVRAVVEQQNGAVQAVADIRAVLQDGRADEAAKLAAQAILLYGASDSAGELAQLKRQADALTAAGNANETKAAIAARLRKDLETALKPDENNLRAAVVTLEQLDAVDEAPEVDQQLTDLRGRLTSYDTARQRAQELRGNAGRLEDALDQLKLAAQAWDTFQVRQEIDEINRALAQRKPRIAVADFEIRGLVGVETAGETIAEELLPHFKGKFDLVEREQLDKVLEELKLEAVDAAANEAARKEVARLGRVRYLVVGSLADLGGLVVNARVIDLQSGLVVQTARIVGTDLADIRRKLPEVGAVLQMSDEEKLAFQQKQAPPVVVAKPIEVGIIPPAPQPLPQGQAMPQPIINVNVAAPGFGRLAIGDLDKLQGAPAIPVPLVIPAAQEDPIRDRLLYLTVLVGDNHFRRAHWGQALRMYELALSLGGPRPDLLIRIDRTRPFVPFEVPHFHKPRIAVLEFLTQGNLPWGLGAWTAEQLPYYLPQNYEVVPRGEMYWFMSQLGLTVGDVVYNPAARLWLGRLLGVRYFVLGSLRETFSFDATAHLVDAEFGYEVARSRIHVQNPFELKLRLPELTRRLFLSPADRLRLEAEAEQARLQARILEGMAAEERLRQIQAANNYPLLVAEARRQSSAGNLTISIDLFGLAQKLRPDSIEVHALLQQDRDRHRVHQANTAWRTTVAAQQNHIVDLQRRQNDLARAAEAARARADREAAGRADAERRARAAEREKAYLEAMLRAKRAYEARRYDVSISLYQDALSFQNTNEAVQALAQARADRDRERQASLIAQKAKEEAALRLKREQEQARLRKQLEEERDRREKAEASLRDTQTARDKARFTKLLEDARAALARKDAEDATTALTTARRVRPEQANEVAPLWKQTLDLQRQLALEKADAAKRAELQREQLEREKAEQLALQNQGKFRALLLEARTAASANKHALAVEKYEDALKLFRTDEVTTGLKKSRDALAREATYKAEADRLANETKKLRTEGLAALAAKDYAKAKLLLADYNKRTPGDVQVLAGIAQAEAAITQGVSAAQREQERKQRAAEFTKLFNGGKASLDAKQYPAAVGSLREALRLDPDHREAKALLAQAEKGLGNTAADMKKAETFQKLVGEGRLALNRKQYDRAETAFKDAQKLIPEDKSLVALLGEVKAGRDAEAARIKAETTKREEELRRAKYVTNTLQTARLALGKKDLTGAAAAIAAAAKVAPDSPDVKKAQNDLAQAEAAARADALAMKKRQDQHNALVTQARGLVQTKPEEALKLLAEADELVDNTQAVKALRSQAEAAIAARLKGRVDGLVGEARKAMNAPRDLAKASQLLREARQLSPRDPGVAAALADLDKIAKEPTPNPRKADYDFAMAAGKAALEKKNYTGAVNSYREALRLMPNDRDATTALGVAQKLLADMNADGAVKRSLDAGRAALKAGNLQVAMNHANEALRLDKDNREATKLVADIRAAAEEDKKERFNTLLTQGRTLLGQKKYKEAEAAAGEALKLYPQNPAAQTLLKQAKDGPPQPTAQEVYTQSMADGQAAERQRKFAEAVREYTEALKAKPNDQAAKTALQRAQTALGIAQNLAAGNAALRMGKWADATKAFNDVLRLDPRNADAQEGLKKAKDKKM